MSYAISADAACAVVEDGAVVLHMRTKRYFSLNETGAALWRMFEDGAPLSEIPCRLADLYEIDVTTAQASLTRLLGELVAEELIVVTGAA